MRFIIKVPLLFPLSDLYLSGQTTGQQPLTSSTAVDNGLVRKHKKNKLA